MRPSLAVAVAVLAFAPVGDTSAQGLTITTSDAGIADSISNSDPPAYTADELATPPHGEIRKLRLREVHSAKVQLHTALALVMPGEHLNPNYRIALTAAQKLDAVLAHRQQEQLFSLIDEMVSLYEAMRQDGDPQFVSEANYALSNVKGAILYEMADYIVRLKANMPADQLARFVNAFTRASIIEMGSWEDAKIPVSEVDPMIIRPGAIIAQLKGQTWQIGEHFLGGATAEEAFASFASSGDASEMMKAKFASNQAVIITKWNELIEWVAQQRAANPES